MGRLSTEERGGLLTKNVTGLRPSGDFPSLNDGKRFRPSDPVSTLVPPVLDIVVLLGLNESARVNRAVCELEHCRKGAGSLCVKRPLVGCERRAVWIRRG